MTSDTKLDHGLGKSIYEYSCRAQKIKRDPDHVHRLSAQTKFIQNYAGSANIAQSHRAYKQILCSGFVV